MSLQLDNYGRFMEALASGDALTAARHVSVDFQASFQRDEGLNEGVIGMDFAHFIREIFRQRTAFPDMGQHVTSVAVAEDGNVVHAVYEMTMTFTGVLVSAHGQGSLRGDGQKVTINQTDEVTFDADGMIKELVVRSSMASAIAQILSEE